MPPTIPPALSEIAEHPMTRMALLESAAKVGQRGGATANSGDFPSLVAQPTSTAKSGTASSASSASTSSGSTSYCAMSTAAKAVRPRRNIRFVAPNDPSVLLSLLFEYESRSDDSDATAATATNDDAVVSSPSYCMDCYYGYPARQVAAAHCEMHMTDCATSSHFQMEADDATNADDHRDDQADAIEASLYNKHRGDSVRRSTSENRSDKIRPKRRYNVNMLRRAEARKQRICDQIAAEKANRPNFARDYWIEQVLPNQEAAVFSSRLAPSTIPALQPKARKAAARHAHPYGGGHRHEQDPALGVRHAVTQGANPLGIDNQLMNLLIQLQHRDITPEDYDALLTLDASVARPTVSRSTINSFPTRVLEHDILEVVCTVCLMPFDAQQTVRTLSCGHEFHRDCIDNWLSQSSLNCPVDNLPVTTR
ncbi:hypothetical protein CAOG_00798 [Capsaspora owczarzaki ATCC 30864]|uniref:RING-type domain-containing protein n=1 Tax=Capsaspora owczarzaki (strain ATCC 30864) TaxID=595528 RepID=A0A0D2WJ63_CAPO3|nr:hypothetical protein CAOG_00798 [Capsaspora owczarzaki ATCC 30864]KJE89298.1 hypothetical protein CAOG_000798 [Capsaspora owczarzaki ATCC 30864]|eukprot:XP_004365669.1 hypothetical protein CAOG_00798 [Capsaspora owczarzaki ATCC 30864]